MTEGMCVLMKAFCCSEVFPHEWKISRSEGLDAVVCLSYFLKTITSLERKEVKP